MNFLFQKILTFYCLNEENRMSTRQKLAVTGSKIIYGKIEHAGHVKYKAQRLKSQSFIHLFTPLKF